MVNRKHVKADIRPYVCLMDNCVDPNETFTDTKDWLLHMEPEHKKKIVRWTCNAKKHDSVQVFDTPQAFQSHMRKEHATAVSENQLPIITKRAGGPAAEMFSCCPLCSWEPPYASQAEAMKTKARIELQRHIAEHLQFIALRSLPDELAKPCDMSIKSFSSSSSTASIGSEQSITQSEIDHLQDRNKASEEELALIKEPVREMSAVDHGEEGTSTDSDNISRDRYWGWVYYGLAKAHYIKPCMYPCAHKVCD